MKERSCSMLTKKDGGLTMKSRGEPFFLAPNACLCLARICECFLIQLVWNMTDDRRVHWGAQVYKNILTINGQKSLHYFMNEETRVLSVSTTEF